MPNKIRLKFKICVFGGVMPSNAWSLLHIFDSIKFSAAELLSHHRTFFCGAISINMSNIQSFL
jgi:hypothetical protein